MGIRIITDSGTDLTQSIQSRVDVVPLIVRFGDKEYADGIDIDRETFYRKLSEERLMPSTSQAAPASFAAIYEEAAKAGDDLIVITTSSLLSGTCQSAVIAAGEYRNVYVVDGRNVALGTGILVSRAVELADKGLSAADISAKLMAERSKVRLIAMVDTLEYLKRGGRLSATAAFAGGLLNIKPVIAIKSGALELAGKARGTKAAFAMMMSMAENMGGIDHTYPYMAGYTGLDDGMIKRFLDASAGIWPGGAGCVPTTVVGSVVGAHAGPGAAAIAFFAK